MTARVAGFDSRAALGLVKPKSFSRRITPSLGGCAAHYGGPAQRLTGPDHAVCRRRWKQWQEYHMGPARGWADIAYTGGFCDHGFALAGRGFGVRTAANGTNDANDRFYAFVWLGGDGERPTLEAFDALEWWIREAREQGAGLAVRAHGEFKLTACAGPQLGAFARRWNNRPITSGVSARPVEEEEMVLVVAPNKPLCLLSRGRLWALQTNAQGDAYEAAGVPRKRITAAEWDDLDKASKHLATLGA